ncbi:retrotransposon protein, putative, ty1-copia subclass [Tanacetum coccineum]
MMIKGGKIQKSNKKSLKAKGKGKANGKGKGKQVYIPKPKNPKPSAKEHPAKDNTCHHYKEVGHCKRSCPAYLAELIKKKKKVGTASSSDFFIIELFSFPTKSWVHDTSCDTHICNTKHGLGGVRKAETIHCLVENGFVQCFTDFGFSVSKKNNVLYFNAIARNGIYEIDMHDLVPNKRIKQLQQDGLLKSTDDESFDKCESCLSGKMTKKPFPHSNERAKDLLGIIHTDVCGPLIHVSRQGVSYFITFTDDYSRYGYVYLLKHKHEVFETFKVFKNKVENQLGKTIKAIRSDRGDEFISHEFKDYLKANRIVQQLTPPYTPQHNGVSERRNRTLLDMVRSMMNLTTCLYPIRNYASRVLQHAFFILFPTRKALVKGDTLDNSNKDILVYLPRIIQSRKLDSKSDKWIDAMNAEIQSMMDNMVWVLVDLPPGCKTVRSKWLFKKKTDMDGIVYTYKACLVANGYTQLYGVDYEEMFSPVADIRAIRILISIAAYYDYDIWQMDVKTTFLNGYLDEDIYIVQPEGFVDPNHPRKVCKLQRSIYGLKQASRSWNKRFDEKIKRFGFSQNHDEPYVYQKASGSNVIFLILYGNHIPSLQSVKDYLGKCFAMKDLGEAAFILGIKIYRDRSKRLIGLCQNAYMDKILKRYKMDNSKRGHIPMQERLDLNKSQGAQTPKEVNRMKNVPYASAVGSIMYAVRCTRPDVAFAQNMTSRFQQNPGEPHWTAVKNILKYLRNTKDMFLVYGGNPSTELRVECYCDAGFETDRDDTKSQTGYVFILNGGAVDWKSSKQSTTAMSATESEYIAASEAVMEVVWIRKFISGLGIVPTINEPLNMYYDNSAAVHYANEPGVQKGARHYQRRYHYVRECVELGEIRILKVHTDNNLADPFTKALSNRKLTQHARGMGLRPASSFM